MVVTNVVVWGHKLYSHTHSYIHGAFVKGFRHLGYPTRWMDSSDDCSTISENTLFVTEGQVDGGIPIRADCYYVLHNCAPDKYVKVPSTRKMMIQVFTHACRSGKPLGNGCYEDGDVLHMPWATDLLPSEIDDEIERFDSHADAVLPVIHFVGMMTEPWSRVQGWCTNGVTFRSVGGFSNKRVSFEENKLLIQQSVLAPAVQDSWQVEHGYIPCRIFKNISYGKMGMTNNPAVQELFGNRLLYSSDIHTLLNMGLEFTKLPLSQQKEKLIPLMEYVRDNHTYLNRIDLIRNFLEKKKSPPPMA